MIKLIGEILFNNIGEKMKKLATIFTLLGIIGSVVLGIVVFNLCIESYLFADYAISIGIAVGLIGCLIFWIASFLI